ncbi:hypothetical protein [Lysobacter terrae]
MRRLTTLAALTWCLLPATLMAQESGSAADALSDQQTLATAAQKPQARKSLMNMVMAALIQSAEQQSAAEHAAATAKSTKPAPPAMDEARQPLDSNARLHGTTDARRDDAAREEVALQADGTR